MNHKKAAPMSGRLGRPGSQFRFPGILGSAYFAL